MTGTKQRLDPAHSACCNVDFARPFPSASPLISQSSYVPGAALSVLWSHLKPSLHGIERGASQAANPYKDFTLKQFQTQLPVTPGEVSQTPICMFFPLSPYADYITAPVRNANSANLQEPIICSGGFSVYLSTLFYSFKKKNTTPLCRTVRR